MKLTLELTDVQEKALTRSNESANPDADTRPSLEAFVTDAVAGKLDEHVTAWRGRDLYEAKATLDKHMDKLTAEDLDAVRAIAAKYEAEPEAVK